MRSRRHRDKLHVPPDRPPRGSGGRNDPCSRRVRRLLMLVAAVALPATLVAATQEVRLEASDGGPNQKFGRAVARHGNRIVVGAERATGKAAQSGAAYVYEKDASGWTEVAKLVASDGSSHDKFGEHVAIQGPVIVVSARPEQKAYVFVRPAGGWSGELEESAQLESASLHHNFGHAVAIDNDTVIIGAPSSPNAAYVFEKPAGGWTGTINQTARLTASDTTSQFGISVAISGDTVAVGDRFNGGNRGAVYVFVRPAGGWSNATQDAKLTESSAASVNLGASVAIVGDTVFGGAQAANEGASNSGAVYAFARPPGGWSGPQTEEAKLLIEAPVSSERLGWSVAASRDVVLAGARGSGSAYVFRRPTAGWSGTIHEVERIQAADDPGAGSFGTAVGLAGHGGVIGTEAEAAYAYEDIGVPIVDLDIEPTSARNKVRRRGIAVAILSDAGTGFDPILAIDTATLTFGLTGDEDSLYRCGFRGRSNRDFNRDGLADLYCSFFTLETGLDPDVHQRGDEVELVIRGETFAGEAFVGTDTVVIKRLR